MNVTRLAGWILLLLTVFYFGMSAMEFGSEYAAAGSIGENAEKYGLETQATNLRFKLGFEFFIDILIAGVLALAGWWLTTTEVIQIVWIIIVGLFTLFSIIIRATPLIPISAAKVSPGGVFYGAKISVPIAADVTYSGQVRQYVVITKRQAVRVANASTPQGQAAGMVVLDLGNQSAATQYQGCQLPLTVTGTVCGTVGVAKGKTLVVVPVIRVQTAQTGSPGAK